MTIREVEVIRLAQNRHGITLEVYRVHYSAEIRDVRTGDTDIVEGDFVTRTMAWPEKQVMEITGSSKRKPPLIFVRLESLASEKILVTFNLQDLLDADFSAVEYC